MKRFLSLLLIFLLGACVLHQAQPVADDAQGESEPKKAESSTPKSVTIRPQDVEVAPLGELDSPISPEDDYERGLEFIGAGRFEAAITHLLRVVEYDPNDSKANYALGFACLKLGEYEDAVQFFTRSQASAPDAGLEVKALVGRGYALHVLGRYNSAIRAYGVALQVAPNSTKALYNRGCSYGEAGEYEKAVADFERVLELNPEYPGARNNLKFYLSKE